MDRERCRSLPDISNAPLPFEITLPQRRITRSVRLSLYFYVIALSTIAFVSFASMVYAMLNTAPGGGDAGEGQVRTFSKIYDIMNRIVFPAQAHILPLAEHVKQHNINCLLNLFENLYHEQSNSNNTMYSHSSLVILYLNSTFDNPVNAFLSQPINNLTISDCKRELVNSTHIRIYLPSTTFLALRSYIFFFSHCEWK